MPRPWCSGSPATGPAPPPPAGRPRARRAVRPARRARGPRRGRRSPARRPRRAATRPGGPRPRVPRTPANAPGERPGHPRPGTDGSLLSASLLPEDGLFWISEAVRGKRPGPPKGRSYTKATHRRRQATAGLRSARALHGFWLGLHPGCCPLVFSASLCPAMRPTHYGEVSTGCPQWAATPPKG
jgi:hypothetical protein